MANRKHQWNPFSISFEGLDLGLTMDEILAEPNKDGKEKKKKKS